MAGWQDAPIVSGGAQQGGWQDAPVVEAAPETAQVQTAQAEEPASLVGSMTDAARAIANDFDAGRQGVNPVALAQQEGQAVGSLVDLGGQQFVDVDGVREPLSDYPADRFVTRVGSNGVTYVYPRTAEMEESGLASIGRMLGLSNPTTRGMAPAKAAAPAPTPKAEAAQATRDLGITPSLGMTGRTGAVVEAGLEKIPTTSARIVRETQRVGGEIEGAAKNIISKVGVSSNDAGAGAALKEGAETFVTGFKTRADKLFSQVDKHLPGSTKVQAPESAAALRAAVEGFEGTPEIAKTLKLGKWTKIADDLESGNLTVEALRKLRSSIGQGIGKISGPLATMDQGQLKNLYAKLSDDLGAIAESAGPEAAKAWTRANEFYRAGQERIDTALTKVLKADTPEKAYQEVLALTKADSRSGSAAKLAQLKRSLPQENWAEVAATVLTKMGQAPAGSQSAAGDAFSPATFLTNWNKTSPEARLLLGQGGLDKGVTKELTALAKVVERYKEAGGARNFSNTAGANSVALFLAGSTIAPTTAITAAGGSILSARALTNRTFLRALNRAAAKGDTSMLQRIAASDSPLAIEAQTILRLELSEQTEGPSLAPLPQ